MKVFFILVVIRQENLSFVNNVSSSSANNKAEEIIHQNKPVLIDINKEDQDDV